MESELSPIIVLFKNIMSGICCLYLLNCYLICCGSINVFVRELIMLILALTINFGVDVIIMICNVARWLRKVNYCDRLDD